MCQKLNPEDVIELDKPDLSYEDGTKEQDDHRYCHLKGDDRLFASCIAGRRNFPIDPYGQMTFCGFIKDPACPLLRSQGGELQGVLGGIHPVAGGQGKGWEGVPGELRLM